jgi:hypothetical protein
MLKILFTISIADVQGPYGNGDFAFIVDIPITYPFHRTFLCRRLLESYSINAYAYLYIHYVFFSTKCYVSNKVRYFI